MKRLVVELTEEETSKLDFLVLDFFYLDKIKTKTKKALITEYLLENIYPKYHIVAELDRTNKKQPVKMRLDSQTSKEKISKDKEEADKAFSNLVSTE